MYVAQLLPNEDQAKVLLTALTEFVSIRGNDWENVEVQLAEELKLKLLKDMRDHRERR